MTVYLFYLSKIFYQPNKHPIIIHYKLLLNRSDYITYYLKIEVQDNLC